MKNRTSYLYGLIFMVGIVLTLLWMYKLMNQTVPYVDQWTRDLVSRLDNTEVYTMFRWITELGSSTFTIPFVIVMAIVFWWLYRNMLPALIFSLGTLFTHYFNVAIKQLVERERPSILIAANAEGHSFPSGHAMISMVCYGLVAFFLSKRLKGAKKKQLVQVFFAGLIVLIGMSRYIINVHYLTDVLAGFFIGFLCLFGFIRLYQWLADKQASPSRG
ncbi:phosphatase PAP2 family protein [Virgibacillus pantothenticus]|uniref:phosphatase PAP2 family protein n=1 Tax=Virgibacillus pantothenticus TaxID=1473 RepID=UPI001C24A70E|nr:phosphatase PAP2 family protein [Virgibacillus pantothenticus]MBU8566919.1 phosphatase PAP2 family protein [Virgibacillus pantothenticus]MBU8600388.1 phosphatase PAP2 family protein [Virgibacillus pantothenticus]MBU8635216.1 phosphatase PAP2 family protein [Virgibacillus pantothenticus]MBU8642638.1 phosphatase PAP2 family protein [Virgibacillus pantothenticus]MBU8646674.1 phosphatase PAP2 family protein [Virgibacillus pantothenticus]